MRAVIEKEVLQESFSGALSDVFIAAYSSVLGVTPAIIQEYQKISDGAGMFQIWFDKVFSSQKNYCLISPDSLARYKLNAACINSNYIGAAFCGSGPVIVKSKIPFDGLNPGAWGVSIVDAATYRYIPADNQAGSKISEIVSLKASGDAKPLVLQKYFLKENKILIFDKSINYSGADFIIEMTKYCSLDCKIVVVSNFNGSAGRGLLDREELERYLNAGKRNGTINVLQADKETVSKYHDRFVFLGDRFQITFSSGINCFGRPPGWINTDGDIVVHCVHNSNFFMEFKSTSGKSYKLKSKG